MYLGFPALGRWQAHPFSIADVAGTRGAETTPLLEPEQKAAGGLVLTFAIRPYSGITRKLLAWAREHPGAPIEVRVEGPFRHHIRLPEGPASEVVFLAAGVGFALVLPFLLHRRHEGLQSAHWVVGRKEDLWAIEEVLAQKAAGALEGLTVWMSYAATWGTVEDEEVWAGLKRLGVIVMRNRLSIGEVLAVMGTEGERAVMACGPERFLDECRACVDGLEGVEYWEEVSTK